MSAAQHGSSSAARLVDFTLADLVALRKPDPALAALAHKRLNDLLRAAGIIAPRGRPRTIRPHSQPAGRPRKHDTRTLHRWLRFVEQEKQKDGGTDKAAVRRLLREHGVQGTRKGQKFEEWVKYFVDCTAYARKLEKLPRK